MKINCPSCGFSLKLDDAYDDYEGQVKCWTCGALLDIKTEDGNIKSVRFVKLVRRGGEPGQVATR